MVTGGLPLPLKFTDLGDVLRAAHPSQSKTMAAVGYLGCMTISLRTINSVDYARSSEVLLCKGQTSAEANVVKSADLTATAQ